MNKIIKKSIGILFATAALCSALMVSADDTDIINIEVPINSNVLFVMDMSGSMSYRLASDDLPTGTEKSRKEVLHEALRTVINAPELATSGTKIGLASFAGDARFSYFYQKGHGISYPVTLLTEDAAPRLDSNVLWNHQSSLYDGETVTSYLPLAGLRTSIGYMGDSIPSQWVPKGKTPIVDALYEAALYFRGGTVDFGRADPSRVSSAHPSTYTGLLYDKTVMVDVPTLQKCGGSTGITCNATVDFCPEKKSEEKCKTSDAMCISDAIAAGYTCDAPYTPSVKFNPHCYLQKDV
jgi:hypothetical protein